MRVLELLSQFETRPPTSLRERAARVSEEVQGRVFPQPVTMFRFSQDARLYVVGMHF